MSLGRCTYCPNFEFLSETEKKRHLAIFHHDKKGNLLVILIYFLFYEISEIIIIIFHCFSSRFRFRYCIYFNFDTILGDKSAIWKAEHRCTFTIQSKEGASRCNLLFENSNQLKEHKAAAQHLKKRKSRKRKTTTGDATSTVPKQMRLDNFFQTGPNIETILLTTITKKLASFVSTLNIFSRFHKCANT